MNNFYVYFLKNNVSGKIFIDYTEEIVFAKQFHKKHINENSHPQKNIRAEKQNNISNYSFAIISYIQNVDANIMDNIIHMYIDYLYTTFSLYNVNYNSYTNVLPFKPILTIKHDLNKYNIILTTQQNIATTIMQHQHNIEYVACLKQPNYSEDPF